MYISVTRSSVEQRCCGQEKRPGAETEGANRSTDPLAQNAAIETAWARAEQSATAAEELHRSAEGLPKVVTRFKVPG